MRDRAYCELLSDTFPVTYSSIGISRFKCQRGAWTDKEVYCTELNSEKCPVFEKLEKLVKEGTSPQ
ncbi:MAG: hypothetical protein NTU63_00725 [Candidatus Pacearchaeota archaeon]|nr:hypothetical protein [Candidatus Pacearchaeota archaeon]